MKNILIKAGYSFLPTALVVTVMAVLVYSSVQQDLRQTANDPQIQIAEDLSSQISAGHLVNANSLNPTLDIEKSLATFVLVYDEAGKFVTGTGRLNGGNPELPSGVFDAAKKLGENRITWQPQKGVRNAIIITHFQNAQQSGYVVVGRSLREVEKRERSLALMVLLGWLVMILGSLFLIIAPDILKERLSRRHTSVSEHSVS